MINLTIILMIRYDKGCKGLLLNKG